MAANLESRTMHAVEKAQALELWRKVDGDGHTFIVDSTSTRGLYHFVTRRGTDYACDCYAGQGGFPCVHAAACWIVVNGYQHFRITLRPGTSPAAPARISEDAQAPVSRNGRGIGYAPTDDDDDVPSQAAMLAALGCTAARDHLASVA